MQNSLLTACPGRLASRLAAGCPTLVALDATFEVTGLGGQRRLAVASAPASPGYARAPAGESCVSWSAGSCLARRSRRGARSVPAGRL